MALMQAIKRWRRLWKSSNFLWAVTLIGLVSGATFFELPSESIPNPASAKVALADVERAVAAKYHVPNVASSEASRLIASGDAVLFDVRESREFDTGHLPGAVHVDPAESVDHFLAKHAVELRGRVAIFYCSVGVRSSILVERVAQAATAYAPVALYNLRGGIFRWFSEGRPVVDSIGSVNRIDPYDESWGRLLQRAMKARG
jgi:rhodanese-related sulfurtransferase